MRQTRNAARTEGGFSLLEMMTVTAVMTVILAVVFSYIMMVQQRYKTEESRLDIAQESREFLDQIVRDLHTVGYPNARMYQTGAMGSPAANNPLLAVGLVAVSATDVWFEGDTDGDGQVNSIRYTLTADSNGNCPCTISRSDVNKVSGAPSSQATKYSIDLQNVVNSAGGGAAYTIAGSTRFGITNDSYYSPYKTAPVFSYFDSSGNPVTVPNDLSSPANLSSGQTAAASVAQISIVLNVLATNPDLKTGVRPAVSMRSQAKINNL
jgi:prepilin-type N-terminal cleavage/methylation domain-containing protein